MGQKRGGKGIWVNDPVFVTYVDLVGTKVGWLTTARRTGKGPRPRKLKPALGSIKSRFASPDNARKITGAVKEGIITDVSARYMTEAEEVYFRKLGKSLRWGIKMAGAEAVDMGPIEWEGEGEWKPLFGEYKAPAKAT